MHSIYFTGAVRHWRGIVFLVIVVFCLLLQAQAETNLKTCYHETLMECPRFALCSRTNSSDPFELKCICLQNFKHNPKWQDIQNDSNSSVSNATSNSSVLEEDYCLPSVLVHPEENQIILYMQTAANPHHLVLGIILVLLSVLIVTALLYGLKVLRPVKRTKAAYKRLKNRRKNITPLQEMDELELNRRYEMETYSIKV